MTELRGYVLLDLRFETAVHCCGLDQSDMKWMLVVFDASRWSGEGEKKSEDLCQVDSVRILGLGETLPW